MSPEVANSIRRNVEDSKLYQKFIKSLSRSKVTLPKASSFNEIVTRDLKSFGSKYVL